MPIIKGVPMYSLVHNIDAGAYHERPETLVTE